MKMWNIIPAKSGKMLDKRGNHAAFPTVLQIAGLRKTLHFTTIRNNNIVPDESENRKKILANLTQPINRRQQPGDLNTVAYFSDCHVLLQHFTQFKGQGQLTQTLRRAWYVYMHAICANFEQFESRLGHRCRWWVYIIRYRHKTERHSITRFPMRLQRTTVSLSPS